MLPNFDRSAARWPLHLWWAASLLLPILVVLVLQQLDQNMAIGTNRTFFVISASAMVLGVIGAAKLMERAGRTDEIELGYLGLIFFTISLMSLSQTITAPGSLLNEANTNFSTAFWTLPLALAVGLPAVLQRTQAGQSIDADWRQWIRILRFVVIAISALTVAFPNLLPAPARGSLVAIVAAILGVVGCAIYSRRHLFLARVARSREPLIVSLAYGLIGAYGLRWLGASALSLSFWVTEFFVIFGTIAGSLGALAVYRKTDPVRPLIEEISAIDPRCALEVGMDPEVHRFVQHLKTTEPATREHIERVRNLVLRVGPKMGVTGTELRDLGLAAILHDIGKLEIPQELTACADLEPQQQKILERHALYGARLLDNSPALDSVAPIVLTHHERIDGTGYPNGLQGPEVPYLTRILSVCDAFDALLVSVDYQREPDVEVSLEILERHAGSRWDRRVVEIMARTIRHDPRGLIPERLEKAEHIGCDCLPKIMAA